MNPDQDMSPALTQDRVLSRLKDGVHPETIQEELVEAGLPIDEANSLVRTSYRKARRKNGLGDLATCVGFVIAAIAVGAGLELQRPTIFLGVLALLYLVKGALGLCKAAVGVSLPNDLRVGSTVATTDSPNPASPAGQTVEDEWLERVLERENAKRRKTLMIVGAISLLLVVFFAVTIIFFFQARSMKKQCMRLTQLLRERSPSLVWAHLRHVNAYGIQSVILVTYVVQDNGKRQRLETPIPIGDADRVLSQLVKRVPHIHLGVDKELKKAYRRNPLSLRADLQAA